MEDEQIIKMYLDRDENAVRETQSKYGGRLLRLSKNILSSQEDAAECVNDTYMKVWNSIPPQKPDNFYAFTATVCRHISLDRVDWNNAAKRKAELTELTNELEQCISKTVESDETDISELINDFLKMLDKKQRIIFVKRYWYMTSIKDIASEMNISVSSVKVSLHRVRKNLKAFLDERGYTV